MGWPVVFPSKVLAPVQLALNEIHVYHDASRHTVYDAADGRSVALAEGRQAEKRTNRIHCSFVVIACKDTTINSKSNKFT